MSAGQNTAVGIFQPGHVARAPNKPLYQIVLEAIDTTRVIDNAVANLSSPRIGAIATGLEIDRQENASITPTVGSQLYLYVGGESYSVIKLSGMAFIAGNCIIQGNSVARTDSGADKIQEFYNDNNVKQTGKYCKLLIGKHVYKGYLVSFKVTHSLKTHSYFYFDLLFYAIKGKD